MDNCKKKAPGEQHADRVFSYLSSSYAETVLGIGVRCDRVSREFHALYNESKHTNKAKKVYQSKPARGRDTRGTTYALTQYRERQS